jgi:hypothetical protein
MNRTLASRVAVCIALMSLAAAVAAAERSNAGADPPAKKAVARPKAPRGRLPAHFAKVVNDQQREMIYGIQHEYEPKIELLQAQLKALKKERDEKIKAVLTPEQQKRIDEAAGRVKPKKEQASTSAEKTPAAPPASEKPHK